jgi:hypothetical protein
VGSGTFDLQDYFVIYCSVDALDPQSRFIQQIALEVIRVDGYNRCLSKRLIVCLTTTKFESFIFFKTCLAVTNGANNDIVMITYNVRLFPP